MPGFHSHDDDFLYEMQSAPNFGAKPVKHKSSRPRMTVSITKWNSLLDTIQKQQMEIAKLQGIIATVKQLLQTARDLEER